MPRSSVVITLAVIGVAAALAYAYSTRTDPASSDEQPLSAPVEQPEPRAQTPTGREASAAPAPAAPDSGQGSTSESVAQWVSATQSPDPKTRAAAIAALADAPTSQAVPALEQVLEVGEPQVDRQIALRSLHVMALRDGDTDGAIRDVLRHALYHGDDEGVTQSAQAVLEDIEEEFAQRAQAGAQNQR
jgi:HEAT repeat protein